MTSLSDALPLAVGGIVTGSVAEVRPQTWNGRKRYSVLLDDGWIYYTWDEGIGQFMATLCLKAKGPVTIGWRRTPYGRELQSVNLATQVSTPPNEAA